MNILSFTVGSLLYCNRAVVYKHQEMYYVAIANDIITGSSLIHWKGG